MENNQIIIKANELIQGRGDGRISINDIKILFEKKYDTIENVNALFHVYNNFNLTNGAKEEFIKNIFKWGKLYELIKKNFNQ